jgi:hypothetical protein
MESTLINYDVDGWYIDHILLSAAHRLKGALTVARFEKTTIYVEIETKKTKERLFHKIITNGTINK